MSKLNPKIDLVFKKLFETEQNINLLKSLINSILPENKQVTTLQLKNPYNPSDYLSGKISHLCIKATDKNGEYYDIKIQVKEQKYHIKQAIFYSSENYSNQLSKSDSYDKSQKTIIISILDFNYFTNDKQYFRYCSYKDFETGEFYPEFNFADLYFVELKKFDNELKNIKTTFDRWITFLNKTTEYDRETIPNELREPEILQATETIETLSLNAKERRYYEAEKKVMSDRFAQIMTAVENTVDTTKIKIAIKMKSKRKPTEKILDFMFLPKTKLMNFETKI